MISDQILACVDDYATRLRPISEEQMSLAPAPGKWSPKEILGHLIDSAQTNIRRFIVSQYEDAPYIVYQQDHWVRLSGYREMNSSEIIDLWLLLNRRLVHIVAAMNEETLRRYCVTGSPEKPSPFTLQELSEDYLRHMQHHLQQIV